MPGFGGGILLDAVILFGLAFGVYKRSRICAALLVGYGTFNEVYMISSGIDKSSALRLIFIYFYIRGMFATFAYHNHPLLSVSTTQDAPQKQSLKFTVRPSDKSSHAAGNESVDSSKPPREAPSEPDGGSGGEERNLGIQRQRNGSESPIIPANWRFSRKSAFVTAGALAFVAISIATWRFAATSRQQTSLQKARSSVALIEVFDAANKAIATGSGFFVSADGMLVTNFHVIEGANRIVVKLENGAMYEVAGVLADNSNSDVVLLRVKGDGFAFLEMGDTAKAEVGQHVTVIGSPLGLEGTVSDGIISAKRELPGRVKWLQITAPIAPGSSGSPVLDANGSVLGVATMLMREGQALNFAVPIEAAKLLLGQVSPNTMVKPLERLIAREAKSVYDDGEFGEALDAIDSKNYVAALTLIKSLEKRFPENEELNELRGITFYGLNLYEDAIAACRQALKAKPDDANIWFILADSDKERGDINGAIVAYQQGLSIKPDNADGWNSLGNAYIAQGNTDRAIEAYQQAVKIKPEYAFAWYNIGRAYLDQKKDRESIAPFQRAVKANPNFAEAWLFLGVSYQDANEHGYAADSLQRYVALRPTDSKGWFFLGLSYRDIKQFDAAVAAFQHNTELEPDHVEGWEELGRAYWRLGKPGDAAATLLHAISMEPRNAKLWELLTVVYRDSGQTENALKTLQKYQTLSSR